MSNNFLLEQLQLLRTASPHNAPGRAYLIDLVAKWLITSAPLLEHGCPMEMNRVLALSVVECDLGRLDAEDTEQVSAEAAFSASESLGRCLEKYPDPA